MRTVIIKAFLVGTVSLGVAMALIFSLVNLLGERFEASMFISAVLGSYGIGSTVSGYLFVQSARYRQALIDLADTHHQLTYAHRLLAERVRRDGMTGMLNRTTFVAELEKYAENREPGALLIIDADHFKVINDSYGHLAGDAALLSIVEAITVATDERAAAARLGGEEFGVFLAGDDMRAALRAAENPARRRSHRFSTQRNRPCAAFGLDRHGDSSRRLDGRGSHPQRRPSSLRGEGDRP